MDRAPRKARSSRTESGHAQLAGQVWGLQVGRFRTAHPHASSNYLSQTPNSLAPGCESHTPKCLPIGCCRGFVTLDSFIGWRVASAQDWLFIEIEWRGGGPAVPSPLLPAPFHPLPGPVHLKLRGGKRNLGGVLPTKYSLLLVFGRESDFFKPSHDRPLKGAARAHCCSPVCKKLESS